MNKANRTSIMSGILVGIGVIVNTSVGNRYIGAFLFSIALLVITNQSLQLFTGQIGYATEKRFNIPNYLLMLLGNIIGITLTSLNALCNTELMEGIKKSSELKFSKPLIPLLLCSIMCGILMFIAVNCKNTLITVLAIMVFILSGYEHCIADVPFLIFGELTLLNIIKYILIVLGNSIGAIIAHILFKQKGAVRW